MSHAGIHPRKILLIKPSALGDVVHTLPILRLLRRRFSDAHIAWMIDPSFADLIDSHPDLNEIILFKKKHYARSWRDGAAAMDLFDFKTNLRDRKFDLAIDLQGLFRSAWLAFFSGAPVRIGFGNAREMAPLFYTHRVPIRSMEVHAIERYRALAEALGCAREAVEFDFAISNDHRAQLRRRAENCGVNLDNRFAVLLPGTNWETKKWPAEHFAALVPMLRERLGIESIVAGGPDAPTIPGAMSLIGQTTLKQLVALLERAEVVIANDTGPMHIAAALGRPLVSVFGPTNPVRTGPYQRMDTVVRLNIACSPCYKRECSHTSCMQWLTPEMVLQRVTTAMRTATTEVGVIST
jgi:lipopolysaccharide heptosyltransferase I